MGQMICDITPPERELLSRLRCRPELYLGTVSLRDLFHLCSGYQAAMETAGLQVQHNILPGGLNEFVNRWYGGGVGSRNWYSMIALHEPEDGRALDVFFALLDEYLTELGYAPIS